MDSKLVILVVLGAFMAAGSYLAGIFPGFVGAEFKYRSWMSFFSMGIMIGTSMIFIIPEGITIIGEDLKNHNISVVVGFPLLLGFLSMFLVSNVDAIFEYWDYNVQSKHADHVTGFRDIICSIFTSPVTIGFVMHAAMDGISLGTTFFSENDSLKFIFYLSIILHKLPTSFSLGTILTEENLGKSLVRYHVLIFALSSPVFSILTYAFIALFKMENNYILGLLFLYSAGMFQYVIVHVITEADRHKDVTLSIPSSSESGLNSLKERDSSLQIGELLATFIGALVPILLSPLGE